MSATNRGGSRIANDFFPTPEWLTEAILAKIRIEDVILDPFAGTGDILAVAKRVFPTASLYAIELNESRAKLCKKVSSAQVGDALTTDPGLHRERVTIVTNPPFGMALKAVERCMELADSSAILLPTSFSGSEERRKFWEGIQYGPWRCDRYDSVRRPSFCKSIRCSDKEGCGWAVKLPPNAETIRSCPKCDKKTKSSSSDAQTYSWFHFQRLKQPKDGAYMGTWHVI